MCLHSFIYLSTGSTCPDPVSDRVTGLGDRVKQPGDRFLPEMKKVPNIFCVLFLLIRCLWCTPDVSGFINERPGNAFCKRLGTGCLHGPEFICKIITYLLIMKRSYRYKTIKLLTVRHGSRLTDRSKLFRSLVAFLWRGGGVRLYE